jgi:hypothetical protein
MEDKKEKWASIQLTREQAVAMAKSNVWKEWTSEQVVRFQMFQERLCMDFSHFHKCVEDVLGRPVFTHEFGFRDDMVREYLGEKEAPSFEDIINLIPSEKRIIIGV